MPTHQWRCPKCHTVLGRSTNVGQLCITKPGTLIERTRSDAIIHCGNPDCGARIVYSGPVRVDARVLTIQRSR
jgi:hypothetical protein